jgi:hypothetical protein
MIKLKKSELEQALLQIASFNPETKEMSGGLLIEEITLGTKRGLQKIHKSAVSAYQELIEDIKTIDKECGEDKDKYQRELKELLEETVELQVEPIKWAFLENISTKANYNFDVIEKLAV